jgi:hypothetical protein
LRNCPTTGDDAFSDRIKAIKSRFVEALPPTEGRSSVRIAKGERGILIAALPWRLPFGHCVSTSVPDGFVATAFLGAYYSGRGRLCAPYGMRALQPGQRWLCVADCALAPFYISLAGGGRCLSNGWMLPSAIGDDNLVTCHSAEHPCGASALSRAASPLPAEIEEL